MNWIFWTRTPPMNPDDCGTIDPLLSLHADGMASAEEAQRVEAHLPGCDACRESLAWMRATQRALASRPIVSPPVDLRARIAAAIAASSAAPAPVSFTVRRSFTLRPVYAAAASVALLGIISYGLLHTQTPQAAVNHSAANSPVVTAPAKVAVVPSTISSTPAVRSAALGVKTHITRHPFVTPRLAPVDPNLVARNQPDQAAPEPVTVKPHIKAKSDTRMLADAAPVIASPKSSPVIFKKSAPRKLRPEMMATNKGVAPSTETHRALVIKPEPKKTDVVVAEAPHNPSLSAPAFIEKTPIITPDPAPAIVAANIHEGRFQTAGLIRIPIGQLRRFTHATISMADKGATYASRTTNPDGFPILPMVKEGLH